jgi:hypothetical protein
LIQKRGENGQVRSSATVANNAVVGNKLILVGYGDVSALGAAGLQFAGTGSTSLVRYTFAGDANVDGSVNITGFNLLVTNFGRSGSVDAGRLRLRRLGRPVRLT